MSVGYRQYWKGTTRKGQLYPCDGIFVELKWGYFGHFPTYSNKVP